MMLEKSNDDIKRLHDLLKSTGALQYSDDTPFKLASGATSNYYFDLRLLNGDPEGIYMVAKILYDYITTHMPKTRSVGGLESGSISIATAISQQSYYRHTMDDTNPLITSFFVRKSTKEHGTKKRVEGKITAPAIIVDDVITSGRSAISAAHVIKEEMKDSHSCLCLMSIIFRGTDAQRKSIEKEIPLYCVFDSSDASSILHPQHVV